MAKQTTLSIKRTNGKVRRPGVHAKTRHSNSKQSKHYKKAYAGQGR